MTGTATKLIMVNDASRAYTYAPVRKPMYVKVCAEDVEKGEGHRCGRLNTSMYGTRPAAQSWQGEFTDVLAQAGFISGRSNPCLVYHPLG